jgi:hypothetical protein
MNEAPKRAVPFTKFGTDGLRRREAYKAKYGHEPDLPRNPGTHRTESKKALLKAIEDIGGSGDRLSDDTKN